MRLLPALALVSCLVPLTSGCDALRTTMPADAPEAAPFWVDEGAWRLRLPPTVDGQRQVVRGPDGDVVIWRFAARSATLGAQRSHSRLVLSWYPAGFTEPGTQTPATEEAATVWMAESIQAAAGRPFAAAGSVESAFAGTSSEGIQADWYDGETAPMVRVSARQVGEGMLVAVEHQLMHETDRVALGDVLPSLMFP